MSTLPKQPRKKPEQKVRAVVVTYILPADAAEKAEACRDILRRAARTTKTDG